MIYLIKSGLVLFILGWLGFGIWMVARYAIRQVIDGGASMAPEVARKVLDALTHPKGEKDSEDADAYNLTPRQCDILRLMADGLVKKEIADVLNISLATVSTHIQRVYEKLHVTTNTGAVAKALREKLI